MFADVFFVEPWWMQLIKSLVIFLVVFNLVPITLLAERKLLGRFQARYGPNRVGPYGAMQPLADIGKLLGKQQFAPRHAQHFLYVIAPCLSVIAAAGVIALIPFGPTVDIFGTETGLYGIDVSIGILFLFALGAVSFYGLMLGGWASTNKYSFLGAMRSAAQLISYEISMALALFGAILMAGTLSLTEIVHAQDDVWFVVPQFLGFLIFMVAGFAEANRAPFDLPEADAELVAGYQTEYGGMRWGSFMLAEYLEMFVISGIAATFFLGGWKGPGPGFLDPIWMLAKILGLMFLFFWVRATLPRVRYDQLMSFGWKVLLPLATLNALVTAVLVTVL